MELFYPLKAKVATYGLSEKLPIGLEAVADVSTVPSQQINSLIGKRPDAVTNHRSCYDNVLPQTGESFLGDCVLEASASLEAYLSSNSQNGWRKIPAAQRQSESD
jgi:hypothetical protein